MNILILNYTDTGGGAAIGAYRLAEALNNYGIKAILGVIKKQTDAPFVQCFARKKFLFTKVFSKIISILVNYCFKTSNKIFHSLNLFTLIDINMINESDFDLVNLHWICDDTINAKDISKIKKPIVWTMHDSWPACGAEHHPNVLENDMRYTQKYTHKNKPASTKSIDICKLAWKNKYRYLHKKNITFTAPSNWEAQVLRDSSLFGHRKCYVVPNLIDHTVFRPMTKEEIVNAKKLFGLDLKKKTVCFGAADNINNQKSIKGGYFLAEALKLLKDKDKYQLVVFGSSNQKFASDVGIKKTFFTGYQSTPQMLRIFYALSDVFVCPSIIENLPFTCLESICCGTPVAAFDVGGIPDIVEHKRNGYLAKPYDVQDLAKGIEYVFQNRNELAKNAIEKSLRDFDSDKTVGKYIEVYKNAITVNGERQT